MFNRAEWRVASEIWDVGSQALTRVATINSSGCLVESRGKNPNLFNMDCLCSLLIILILCSLTFMSLLVVFMVLSMFDIIV